ncbi:MAG: hypothetical protein MK101_10500 [Phycisphaerales bacterium]|nr:hypothetical protein [Phycisphaerales bacterium]
MHGDLKRLEGLELDGIVAPPSLNNTQDTSHPCTLVLLHGYGANAGDLLGLRDEIDPTMACVALQAPVDLGPMGMPGGRAWFQLQMTPEGDITYDTAGAMSALRMLERVVPQAAEQATSEGNASQIVVLGFSQGAMLGHGLLLKSSVELAGLAACSGRLVPEIFDQRPLDVPAGLPVFLSHGSLDEVIPVASGHAIKDAYQSDSSACVTWVESPIGHGISPDMLDALRTWFGSFSR